MTFRGNLELVSPGRIRGWAWDTAQPDTAISVVLSVDDVVIGRTLADLQRADLFEAGIGDGRHGFDFRPTPPLEPLARRVISVRREGDGTHIPNSPRTLEPPSSFDQSTRSIIAQLLTTVHDAEDLEGRLVFVSGLANQLRQMHADSSSDAQGREARRRRRLGHIDGQSNSAEANDRPRALVIDNRMPQGGRDAGSNAILSHMRSLQRLGYEVTFAPTNLQGDGTELEAEEISCCLQPWYGSIEEILTRQRNSFALVYLHRVSTAGRYALLVRDHQHDARIVYSVADLHHLRLARQAKVEGRPELLSASGWMRTQEFTTAWLSDAVITHSSVEADLLRRHIRPERVHKLLWSIKPRPTSVPLGERRGLAFVGGYGHSPNVDAALWLVEAVLPEVEALGATLPCLLVGSEMPSRLLDMQRSGVESLGQVPDLGTVFDRVRLTVAPLAYGAGVKGKVLDSLAAGVPCVCTPAAAEGIDLPPPLLDLVASSPSEIARSILRLHEDEALNRACSEAGLEFIRANASEAAVDKQLRSVVRA